MSSQKNELLPREEHLSFSFQARYFTMGAELSEAKYLVIALHGYGQLAPYFSRKFGILAGESRILIPEGLHRFYSQGSSGRVGASWMTKENREFDILNYQNYLESLVDDMARDSQLPPIVLLGFSQGAATAGRWLVHTKYKVNHLILWAGMFPHDVPLGEIPQSTKVHVVCGDDDPYFDDERILLPESEVLSSYDVRHYSFKGAHEIPIEELKQVFDRIST